MGENLNLSAKIQGLQGDCPRVLCVTRNHHLPVVVRESKLLILDPENTCDTTGFGAVLYRATSSNELRGPVLPVELEYLREGDIVRVNPLGNEVRVLFRVSNKNNALLITERCNSKCLMCSQPPRDIDDGYLVDELFQVVKFMPRETEYVGFTGGEPTTIGTRLFELIESVQTHLPNSVVTVLTNGRRFSYPRFAFQAKGRHSKMLWCIPLYSDVDHIHDFVVQANGAFDQTVRGIINLASIGEQIEIRVVLHKQTVGRLPELCEFISRNLPFVQRVALMGLEITGFTKANLEALWIDPIEYQTKLSDATRILLRTNIRPMIYNLPLCLVPKHLWPYAQKSISDWKNVYFEECQSCTLLDRCGGFFASAVLRHSEYIHAFSRDEAESEVDQRFNNAGTYVGSIPLVGATV